MSSDAIRTRRMRPPDSIDRRILDLLQADATISIGEIAARVGLSQTPCWRRIHRLERDRVIERRVALIDPARVGLGVSAVVLVTLSDHSALSLRRVSEVVAATPEVIGAHRLAGQHDYMLQVVAADMEAYEGLHANLIARLPVKSATTHLVLERLKSNGPLPVTPPST